MFFHYWDGLTNWLSNTNRKFAAISTKKKFVKFYFHDTVNHVYNGHPWDLKKVAVWNRCLIKLRFRLVVDETIWPLLTGGRYSQVVVKTCLTVYFFLNKRFKYFSIYLKLKLIFEVLSTRTVFHYLLVSTKTFGESKILRNHYFFLWIPK